MLLPTAARLHIERAPKLPGEELATRLDGSRIFASSYLSNRTPLLELIVDCCGLFDRSRISNVDRTSQSGDSRNPKDWQGYQRSDPHPCISRKAPLSPGVANRQRLRRLQMAPRLRRRCPGLLAAASPPGPDRKSVNSQCIGHGTPRAFHPSFLVLSH